MKIKLFNWITHFLTRDLICIYVNRVVNIVNNIETDLPDCSELIAVPSECVLHRRECIRCLETRYLQLLVTHTLSSSFYVIWHSEAQQLKAHSQVSESCWQTYMILCRVCQLRKTALSEEADSFNKADIMMWCWWQQDESVWMVVRLKHIEY